MNQVSPLTFGCAGVLLALVSCGHTGQDFAELPDTPAVERPRDEVSELAARIVAASEARALGGSDRSMSGMSTSFAESEDEPLGVVTTTTEVANLPAARPEDDQPPMLLDAPSDLASFGADRPAEAPQPAPAIDVSAAPSGAPAPNRPLPLVRSTIGIARSTVSKPTISVSEAGTPTRSKIDDVRTAPGGSKSSLPPGIRVTPLRPPVSVPRNEPFSDIVVGLDPEGHAVKAFSAQPIIEDPNTVGFGAPVSGQAGRE